MTDLHLNTAVVRPQEPNLNRRVHQLKNLLLCAVVLILAVACVPANLHAQTITAAQVFYSPNPCTSGQHLGLWRFFDGYGDQMTINIWCPSTDLGAGTVVWSYDKFDFGTCRGYWQPGTCNAHLDFLLTPQPDGSYVSPASLITFPQGCSWCIGWTIATADVTSVPGEATPYVIIPATATTGHITVTDTDYVGHWLTGTLNFNSIVAQVPSSAMTHWRTESYIQNVQTPSYNGPALISEQWEGPCFDSTGTVEQDQPGCTHEKWSFAPAVGLVKVQVFYPTNDRNLDMMR